MELGLFKWMASLYYEEITKIGILKKVESLVKDQLFFTPVTQITCNVLKILIILQLTADFFPPAS